MDDWIKSALSKEQQSPLNRHTKNACILAGAGSGKTRALAHLLAADLQTGIPPSSIVAFTFTEKAADELMARIHLLCCTYLPHITPTGMYVGTIHAWCLQYLYEQAEFYNFNPIDELHLDSLVSRFYDVLKIEKTYSKPYPKGIEKFLADVEIFYNENLTLDQVPSTIRPSLDTFFMLLQNNQLLTFGGMVRNATEYLQENGPVSQLKVLYVDEYQDVNAAQVALIKAMINEDGSIIAVGDDLQCIYQWRGSDVSRILNFSDEFTDVSIHRLFTNYRSRPQIVELGNQVGANINFRDPEKMMTPGREKTKFPVIRWINLDSEKAQARNVVKIIERLNSEGVPYNKIAVLLRSVLGSGRPIVDELEVAKMPVYCPILSRGGALVNEFLIPIFKWLMTEHHEPRNQIEEMEMEQLANDLWNSVRPWISSPNAEIVFWEGINKWLDLIEIKHNDAYNVRNQLYDFLDLCGCYPLPDDNNMLIGLGIASQVIRSVEEIHRRRFKGYRRRTPRGIMSEIFYSLIRRQEDFGESLSIDTDMNAVVVTTVHQAKGLEWPVVILPNLAMRRFPVNSRRHGTSFPDEIAERYGTSLEDERRLFYVAVTRAKERLFLLDHTKSEPDKRSIFLTELKTNNVINPSDLNEISTEEWKIPEENLYDTDPPPVRIALSDLLIYLECPYQFALRRTVSIQPSIGDELGFGRGLHELIQRRLSDEKNWTRKELQEKVDRHVNLPYMSEQAEIQSKNAILNRIQQLDDLGVFQSDVESEVAVEVFLEEGIVYGIVDGIQADSDWSVSIRDWKSNIHETFLPRYQKQLQFYTLALRAQEKIVTNAEIVDIAASYNKGTLISKKVSINNSALKGLFRSTRKALKDIREGMFVATPGNIACACCDMYRCCSERDRNETIKEG